ncbi:MAG: OmpH family outer membrane protein [Planctomycetota bacterium]
MSFLDRTNALDAATTWTRFGTQLAVALTIAAALFASYSIGVARTVPASANRWSAMPTRVAMVDLEYLFEESKRKKEKQAELERFIQETDQALQELEAQRQAAVSKLEMSKPDSDQARELQEQIVGIKAQLEFRSKSAEQRLQRDWEKFRGQHLDEIRVLIEEYAVRNDIDMVLQKQLPKQPDTPTWEMVFWSKPELDLTGPILALLNG